ncbi:MULTISPECIES: flagellar biosynthetic protein FliO [unclassified Enterobacter]
MLKSYWVIFIIQIQKRLVVIGVCQKNVNLLTSTGAKKSVTRPSALM